jgi:hypothetical protein
MHRCVRVRLTSKPSSELFGRVIRRIVVRVGDDAAVSRRLLNPSDTIVPRSHTYDATVWDSSIVQKPISVAPCQNPDRPRTQVVEAKAALEDAQTDADLALESSHDALTVVSNKLAALEAVDSTSPLSQEVAHLAARLAATESQVGDVHVMELERSRVSPGRHCGGDAGGR